MSSAVHPELADALKRLPPLTFRRWNLPLMRLMVRLAAKKPDWDGVSAEWIPLDNPPVRLRLLTPRDGPPRGALLWAHGGGFVVGATTLDDAFCARLVRELGIAVASVDYRLAPKHPFPAALDDCHAGWHWLLDYDRANGLDASKSAIGGRSAGAGLAACLAQRVRDEGGPQPAGQLLVYPMLDDRTATRRELDAAKYVMWNNTSNLTGWSSYLGLPPGGPSLPEYAAASRSADLSNLPPAWLGVGSLDLFWEEGHVYARRLTDAGTPCDFYAVDGACHGFDEIIPNAGITHAFEAAQVAFLRTCIGF